MIRTLPFSTLALTIAVAALASAQQPTELVSVATSGAQGDGTAGGARNALSDDGRVVAFSSAATNLVGGDTNSWIDVFVRDRALGTTELVSRSSAGEIGNGASNWPSISDDGRYVAFESWASNLVAGDTQVAIDVFVHDRSSGTTMRVSELPGGGQPDGQSSAGFVSGDGRFVSFTSWATNLVPGDTNGEADIFVRELATGAITRVSVDSSGAQAAGQSLLSSLSDDGRVVVFASYAENLWPADSNQALDVFFHDRASGATEPIDLLQSGATPLGGAGWDAWISGDGAVAAFTSDSTELGVPAGGKAEVFVRELASGIVTLSSRSYLGALAATGCGRPSLSDDGRWLAFDTKSPALVNLDVGSFDDVFVVDRVNGEVLRASMSFNGTNAIGDSSSSMLSGDGRAVAFSSYAYDMVGGDGNGLTDVFVHATDLTQPLTYCVGKLSSKGCQPVIVPSGMPSLSQPSGFVIHGFSINRDKSGLIFYGHAPSKAAFQGGTLCVQPPIRRCTLLDSGGTSGDECSGAYAFDFNAWLAAGQDPSLGAGDVVYGQYWFRDPQHANGPVGLTDAVRFVIYL